MFGIGFPELILIMALALIVVGPDKLPDLARSIAKTLVDLKKTAEGFKESLNEEENPLSEIKPELEDAARKFKETVLDAETKTWKAEKESQEYANLDPDTRKLLDQTLTQDNEASSTASVKAPSPPPADGDIDQKDNSDNNNQAA